MWRTEGFYTKWIVVGTAVNGLRRSIMDKTVGKTWRLSYSKRGSDHERYSQLQ